ncbi:MAG TPA: hypothetical protein ENI02_00190 [Candidatus Aminicenantes bacterium]|nr:hypothetical protein [Candidatus Aminicenantes bacterium]
MGSPLFTPKKIRKILAISMNLVFACILLLTCCSRKDESSNDYEWIHPSSLSDNISPDGTDVAMFGVAISMDNNENAIILWRQKDDSGNYQIFMSEYRNGVWLHPSSLSDNISPDSTDARDPEVLMDNNENAVIVWQQKDDIGNDQIFMSEYRYGVWIHPSSLFDNISPDSADASHPKVSMDNNGNAVIVWQQKDDIGNDQIFMSEYRNGAWIHPSSLSDNISPDGWGAEGPEVSMDSNGTTIIVWQKKDNSDIDRVFKSEYRDGAWIHPSSLSDSISPEGDNVTYVNIAMDENGNAITVWVLHNTFSGGFIGDIFTSEYRNGSWNNPFCLYSPKDIHGYYPLGADVNIAMNNKGDAIVFSYLNGGFEGQDIIIKSYQSSEWTNPRWIDSFYDGSVDTSKGFPSVVISDNGDAIIVWSGSDNTIFRGGKSRLFKSEYRNEEWNHASSAEDYFNYYQHDFNISSYDVAIDNSGNTIIVWSQKDDKGNFQIFKSEYSNGEWTHPSPLSDNISPDNTDARGPKISMDDNGNTIIVWRQIDDKGNDQIYMSYYR